ncbi:hypothetical protein I4U23_003835 [Adineta vaga]|nr:hypothetical protein I4U23_003835 [Adineta vaga]
MSAITLVFLTIFLIGGEIGGYASVTATEPTCSNFGALKYLNQYNLITLGDLSTSSDVEYKTLVCGALKSSSSANFAIHLGQSETSPSTSVLEIAESITDGNALNVQVGSVAVGKSTDKIVKQGNVPYKVNNRQFNINGGNQGGQVVCDSQLAAKCARVSEDLKALSLTLSKRTPNNNIVFPTNQPGPLNINIGTKDSDGFAFLTVADGNSFFHNQKVQQIEIKNNVQASWIIINLGGKTISFDQGNIVGSLTQLDPRSRILFNFYEAERISMQRNFMGAMLAPLAAVDTNSNIDGATAVRSLTTNAELHKPFLNFQLFLLATKREITEKSSTTQRTQSPSTEPQNNGTSTTTKTSSTRTNTPTAVTTKLTTAKPKPTNKGSCSQSDESDDDSSDENHDRSSPKRQRSKGCSRRVRITRILSSTSGRGTSDRRCAKCALRYISFTVVLEGITLDQITNQCNKRYMEHFKQSVSNQIRKYQSNGFKSMRITSLSTDKPNSLIVELLFTVTPKYNQQITVAIQRALTSFQFDRLVDDKE